MSHKNESWLGWTLFAIGFAGAGFAAGLHRFVWGLFCGLSIIWVTFWWFVGANEAYAENGVDAYMLLLLFGAPLVVGIVLRFVEGIVFSLFGGQSDIANSSAPSSLKTGEEQN